MVVRLGEIEEEERIVFKTTDEKEFTTQADARYHQAILDLSETLTECGVGYGGQWDREMIRRFMMEEADTLGILLSAIASRPIAAR